jgi:hypothetical protein
MALQRTCRPRIRSGRSLRALGSPLNARPLGITRRRTVRAVTKLVFPSWRGTMRHRSQFRKADA